MYNPLLVSFSQRLFTHIGGQIVGIATIDGPEPAPFCCGERVAKR